MSDDIAAMDHADTGDGAGDTPEPSAGTEVSEFAQKVAKFHLLATQSKFQEAMQLGDDNPELYRTSDSSGHTLLHWAALAGNRECIQKCLLAGVPVDVLANNQQTPLHWAVIQGRIDAALVLLSARANIRLQDSFGAGALTLAVQHQQHETTLFIFAREDTEKLLSDRDTKGCAPIHWAAYKGDATSVRLLLYFRADLNMQDHSRMTPMHRAVQSGPQNNVIKLLCEKMANPVARDSNGRTPLDLAGETQNRHAERILGRILGETKKASIERTKGERVVVEETSSVDVEDPAGRCSPRPEEARGLERARKGLAEMAFKERAVHFVAPSFWIISVSLSVVEYLIELRGVASSDAPLAGLGFELGVVASLSLYALCVFSDPGKVKPKPQGASAVEAFLAAFSPTAPEGFRRPEFGRLCTSTFVMKGLRTKYCSVTEACVEEFDHFCGWLNVAIGRGNHRPFILLACTEVFAQICFLIVCWNAAAKLGSPDATWGAWLSDLAYSSPHLFFLMVLHGLTAPNILVLFLTHLRLIAVNMTTNEMINVNRYTHFWVVETSPETGLSRKQFKNPFHKGNVWLNCLDFWWYRRRGELGPKGVGQPFTSLLSDDWTTH